jgi:hypothetical protein
MLSTHLLERTQQGKKNQLTDACDIKISILFVLNIFGKLQNEVRQSEETFISIKLKYFLNINRLLKSNKGFS